MNVEEVSAAPKAQLTSERIQKCSRELSETIGEITALQTQGWWKRTFFKADNIKALADNMQMAEVQQTTLDLIVLMTGAAVRMKRDYNHIMGKLDGMMKKYGQHDEAILLLPLPGQDYSNQS